MDEALNACTAALEVYPGHIGAIQGLAWLAVREGWAEARLDGWLGRTANCPWAPLRSHNTPGPFDLRRPKRHAIRPQGAQMLNPFQGSFPALPTPMRAGALDLEALDALIEAHLTRRTAGLVVCGTTGEAATLSGDERAVLVDRCVSRCAGRMPVIVGVGTNVTQGTVRLAREARDAGADGLLVVTPYYNKPSPRGLLAHFGAVAEATELPVVLYNVPSRTACDLLPELAAELRARHSNVVAIKEATNQLERVHALARIEGLGLLCGEDTMLTEFARAGADGTVSVVANLAPDAVADLLLATRKAPGEATQLARALAPLTRALFIESNPVPLKHALEVLGWCSDEVRLPLAPLEEANRRALEQALIRADELLMRPVTAAKNP
jgi:4-hydroxy-tetrahydrodipicolinate synthase